MDPGINQPGGWNQKDELMEGCNLALYGRGDHSKEEVLTLSDRQKMAFRQALMTDDGSLPYPCILVCIVRCLHQTGRT